MRTWTTAHTVGSTSEIVPIRRQAFPRSRRLAFLAVLLCLVLALSSAASSAETFSTDVDAVATAKLILQAPPETLIGPSIAAVQNLTGDGRPSLVVGAPGAKVAGRPAAGEAFVVFPTARTGTMALGDPGLAGFRIIGAYPYDTAGFVVTSAGDVNGDSRGDILLSAPRMGFECASAAPNPCGDAPHDAYVIYGKATDGTVDLAHLRRSQGFVIKGVPGAGIAGLGRFDGSRYGAIAVDGTRYAYVIYGGPHPSNVDLAHVGKRGFRITAGGPQAGPLGVAPVGDFNGDGCPDLMLYKGPSGIRSGREEGLFVLFGRHYTGSLSAYHLGRHGFAVRGATVGVGVGDVNGDHRADLLVQRYDPMRLELLYGGRSTRTLDSFALGSRGRGVFYGPQPAGQDLQLNALAGLGDLNGDGLADFGVATETFRHGTGPYQGTVSVLYGARNGPTLKLHKLGAAGYQLTTPVPPTTCPPLTPAGNELGHGLTALGNFNGHRQPEFAVSALGLGPPSSSSPCALPGGEVLVETRP